MKNKLPILLAIVLVFACLLISCNTYTTDKEAVKIAVNSFANYELYQGDELNFQDATIVVTYSDGSSEEVPLTSDMVTGYNKNKVGPVALTVSYKKLTATVNVEVKALEIQRIAVHEAPEEISVVQGGKLDLTGVSLMIYYQNKTSILGTVTEAMVTGFSSELAPGEHTVYLNLSGYTTPLQITVVKKSIESIAVTTDPSVNNYFVGETFNPAGMAITITYNNETQDIVYYTSETQDDFGFDYDFSFALTSSPVTVTYLEDYSTVHYLVVATPVCTNLEFSYSEAVLNETTGTSSIKVFSFYPTSYGVYIEGVRQTPNQITALVEGDRIDWSSGKARLSFDDGTKKMVSLSDNSIYVQVYDSDNKLVSYKDHVYDTPGNYTLYVSYGNMSKLTPLYVTVKEKRAVKLMLFNTESATSKFDGTRYVDRVYYDGEKVITDLIRYNLLYDNGTYLCDKDNTSEWAELTVDMLDENSDFTVDYAHSINGKQRIGFIKNDVTAYIEVKVQAISVVTSACVLTPPAQDVVLQGSSQSLIGGSLYIEYSDGSYQLVDLEPSMITYYESIGNTQVNGFEYNGDYYARVYYEGYTGYYSFTVDDVVVDTVSIKNPPSSTLEFDNFAALDFSGLYLEVSYSSPNIAAANPTEFPTEVEITKQMMYSYDRYNTGYQEITFRYGGKLTTNVLPIKIKGRYETYIEIKDAPDKVVYKVGEAFDTTGLVINKHYSDGTFIDVNTFTGSNWEITPDDNTSVGQKQLKIVYKNRNGEEVGEPVYLGYAVIVGNVAAISIDMTQEEFADYSVTSDDKTVHAEVLQADGYDVTQDIFLRVLKITKNEPLNATGLVLHVTYEDEGAGGENYSEDIKLEGSYINYDKSLNVYNDGENVGSSIRKLTVNYGGKTTQFWIYVLERELTSIEVIKLPNIKVYADGQSLKLAGGELRRTFNDGSTDVLPMQNGLITHDYNANYFDTFVSSDRYVVQNVTVNYGGCSAQMDITTYRRTTAEEIISYSDTVSTYGSVKTPKVTLVTSIENFVVPEVEILYKVNKTWVSERPSVPGTYAIRIVVIENEYYIGSTIENQNMVIIPKLIEIRAADVSKTYGEDDPELTYAIEGDGVDADGNYINTVLVWNLVDGQRVQDKLVLKLIREEGEDVLFDETGAVKSYKISYELVAGNNQNDRYLIDFYEGNFKIERLVVSETLFYNGYMNLTEDGSAKNVVIYFTREGVNVFIDKHDIIYYKEEIVNNYVKLSDAPSEAGNYRVSISKNYNITGGNSYCDFSINEA